jgi:hypothetical protein
MTKRKPISETHPYVAQQWHPDIDKNGGLKPEHCTSGMHRRILFKCPEPGCGHEWTALLYNAAISNPCPKCIGKVITDERLIKEWDEENRKPITAFKPYSRYKAKWKCSVNPAHRWSAPVYSRFAGNNCPFCANQATHPSESLLAIHPEIAEEWVHPIDPDTSLKPIDVVPGSHLKVLWKCKRYGHVTTQSVEKRVKSNGRCPKCHKPISRIELRIFTELKQLFPDAIQQYQAGKYAIDICIPRIKLFIEVDGWKSHRNRQHKDQEKNAFLRSNYMEWHLLRLRDERLPASNADELFTDQFKFDKPAMDQIIHYLELKGFIDKDSASEYTQNESFIGAELYEQLLPTIGQPSHKNSLTNFPLLVKEWHKTRNGKLAPEDFSKGANVRVWWSCSIFHYEWSARIDHRTGRHSRKGSGCPRCAGRKV